MFFKRTIIITFVLFVSIAPSGYERENICYLFGSEGVIILNGNIKRVTTIYESRTNPGQDFDVIDVDRKGNMTRAIHGFHGATLSRSYVTNYDKFGKKSETINYLIIPKRRKPEDMFNYRIKAIDSTKRTTEIYVYNSAGQIIRAGHMFDGPISENFYKYNKSGDLAESDMYDPPQATYYKYDNHHNVVELNGYIHGHFTGRNAYKYISFDKHNNWTKVMVISKLGYESSGKSFAITRDIIYY